VYVNEQVAQFVLHIKATVNDYILKFAKEFVPAATVALISFTEIMFYFGFLV